jgi:hypothetical protein
MFVSETLTTVAKHAAQVLNPRDWPSWLLNVLRACGFTVAYAAAFLLSLVWLSAGLATLKSPLFDLGKPHVSDAIIAFSHYLSLSPEGIYMLAHMLVGIKILLGTFLFMAVSAGIYGRLRGAGGMAGDEALDLALFLSAVATIVAGGPVLSEINGLHQIVGELMLCIIASALINATHTQDAPGVDSRAEFATVEALQADQPMLSGHART